MIKDLAILAVALLTAVVAFFADTVLLPGIVLLGLPYFVSILISAYFLSPRVTAGVTIFTIVLKLMADLSEQAPSYLSIMYLIALALVGFLSTSLASKMRREATLAAEAQAWRRKAIDIFESIADGFFVVDREWRITCVNKQAEPLLRHRREELVGKNLWEVFPEAVDTIFYEEYHRALDEKVTVGFQQFYPPFNTWFEVRAYPTSEGLSVYFRDITERRRAEEEHERLLKEVQYERARWQSTVDNMVDLVTVCDVAGRVVYINPAYSKMIGLLARPDLPLEEHPKYYHLFHSDGTMFAAEDLPLQRAALRNEVVRDVEIVHRAADGREFIGVFSAAPLHDDRGNVIGAVAVGHDITEQRRSEEERERLVADVQHRAAELDALIENMAEGVAITDSAGQLLRVNRAGRQILGVLSPQSVPRCLTDIPEESVLAPDGHRLPTQDWPFWRALRGEVFAEQEVVYVRPNGDRRHLLMAGSGLRDAQGTIRLAITVFRDITAIRDLERQREEFISVVAHDLRGAITSIRGFSDLLMRTAAREGVPETVQRSLEMISSGTRRMERMIADLLDVSRIEARTLSLVKSIVDLPSLVQDVVARSEELTKGHPVKVFAHGEIPQLEADPDRIDQILTNLLSNAGKYSYPDTEIAVEVEPRPGEVTVSVTNLGPGVLPEDREKLFTRFHRTRQAQEEKVPGLGLGLYIAKGLVDAHGGRIWVESEPGKYATFRFTLPLAS